MIKLIYVIKLIYMIKLIYILKLIKLLILYIFKLYCIIHIFRNIQKQHILYLS